MKKLKQTLIGSESEQCVPTWTSFVTGCSGLKNYKLRPGFIVLFDNKYGKPIYVVYWWGSQYHKQLFPLTQPHTILTANIYIHYYFHFHFHPQLSPLHIHTLLSHLTLISNIVSSCTPTHYYFRYHLYPPLCPLIHPHIIVSPNTHSTLLSPLIHPHTLISANPSTIASPNTYINFYF